MITSRLSRKGSRGWSRRDFFGVATGTAAATFWANQDLDAAMQRVNPNSKPSDLKITDLRVAVVGNFNPPRSGRHYQAEVLANAFEGEGAHVLRVTYEQTRYWRPLATIREL